MPIFPWLKSSGWHGNNPVNKYLLKLEALQQGPWRLFFVPLYLTVNWYLLTGK